MPKHFSIVSRKAATLKGRRKKKSAAD